MMTTEECVLYDRIVELDIATPDEINLVFNCIECKNWTDCLNRIIYSRTGYRSLEQYLEDFEEDPFEDDEDFEEDDEDEAEDEPYILSGIPGIIGFGFGVF